MKMTWKIFWAYMALVGVVAFRCFAENIPYVDADSIKVVSNSLNNFGGLLTNDPNSNVNAQTVFDAIDDMMLPTSTNIVVNTNDWQTIDPTNNILQQALDWIDDNWHTNISNTNIYMTGAQNSNAFMTGASASNSFIVDGPGTVVGSNLALAVVAISNVEPGYLKMPRIAGFTSTSLSNGCAGCAGASVSMLATTQYTRTTFLYGYCTLSHTSVPVVNVTNIEVSVSAWVGPTNGGVFQQVADVPLSLTFSTGALATANSAVNGSFCFPVPASNYVTFLATAVNTNALQQDRWYIVWKLNATDATLP